MRGASTTEDPRLSSTRPKVTLLKPGVARHNRAHSP
jgi:hypothetical protein